MELIVKRGSGFIYYISREGVTGMQSERRVESCHASRQNPRTHESAHRRRLRHLQSRTGETGRAKRGRRRRRQRGGESNRRKRKIKRFGQARRQICEITGRCGEINLFDPSNELDLRHLLTNLAEDVADSDLPEDQKAELLRIKIFDSQADY